MDKYRPSYEINQANIYICQYIDIFEKDYLFQCTFHYATFIYLMHDYLKATASLNMLILI